LKKYEHTRVGAREVQFTEQPNAFTA